jgi:hypothetical protein
VICMHRAWSKTVSRYPNKTGRRDAAPHGPCTLKYRKPNSRYMYPFVCDFLRLYMQTSRMHHLNERCSSLVGNYEVHGCPFQLIWIFHYSSTVTVPLCLLMGMHVSYLLLLPTFTSTHGPFVHLLAAQFCIPYAFVSQKNNTQITRHTVRLAPPSNVQKLRI